MESGKRREFPSHASLLTTFHPLPLFRLSVVYFLPVLRKIEQGAGVEVKLMKSGVVSHPQSPVRSRSLFTSHWVHKVNRLWQASEWRGCGRNSPRSECLCDSRCKHWSLIGGVVGEQPGFHRSFAEAQNSAELEQGGLTDESDRGLADTPALAG